MTQERWFPAERNAVLSAVAELKEEGFLPGTSGNLSVRVRGGMLVTPTGMRWGALSAADLVFLDAQGEAPPGQRTPTSEWRIHTDIYAGRPEVNAVVHGHPRYATSLSCVRQNLPAVHYMIAVAGTDEVRCARYAVYGSQALSNAVLEALGPAKACLMANHGMVALGGTLGEAVKVALEIERVADLWFHARQLGTPVVLGPVEMQDVQQRFATYGQQRQRRRGGS